MGEDGQERAGTLPADPTSDMFQATEGRWGSREVEITDVAFLDATGRPSFVFHSGDPMSHPAEGPRHAADRRLRVRRRPVQRRRRVLLRHEHVSRGDESGAACAATREATFAIDSLDLVEGTYKVDVAVHKRDGYPYDYHRLLYTFRVKSRVHDVGIYRPRHTLAVSPDDRAFQEPEDDDRDDAAAMRRSRSSQRSAGAPGRPSSSPTASSICCTSATFATCNRRAALGDALIVGVNSDRSVRANKGPDRPITPEDERVRTARGARLRRRRRRSSTRTRRTI